MSRRYIRKWATTKKRYALKMIHGFWLMGTYIFWSLAFSTNWEIFFLPRWLLPIEYKNTKSRSSPTTWWYPHLSIIFYFISSLCVTLFPFSSNSCTRNNCTIGKKTNFVPPFLHKIHKGSIHLELLVSEIVSKLIKAQIMIIKITAVTIIQDKDTLG